MNIGNLAPDPEAFNQQMAQMTEMLNSSSASDWPEEAQITHVSTIAFEFDTTSIAEEFGLFVDSSPLGASTPHLKVPNEQTLLQPTTAQNISATLKSMGMDKPPEVTSFAGVNIDSPMLQQLAQFQPLTKLAILEMGEEKLQQELTLYFEGQGMPVPQNPEDASFKKAMFEIFNERMDNSSALMPKELTYQLQDSLLLLGDAMQYVEFASNIQAPNITAAQNPNVQLGMQMLESMEDMIDASIKELENAGQAPKSGGILEFMKTMMDMLQAVKMAMFEAQMGETDNSHQMMLAKKSAIETRTQKQLEEYKKQEKQMKLEENMKVFQDTLEILMPCLQILFIIIAVIFLPLAPMVILLSTIVSIALISVQIALTEEGIMESSFESINTFAAELYSFAGDEDVAELLFWITAIIAILVIAVMLIMVPGVAAVVPAIAGTIIGWIVSNSGIVDTITDALTDLTGWDDEWAEAVYGALAGMSISLIANGTMVIAGMIRQLVEELVKIVFELITQIVSIALELIMLVVTAGVTIITKIADVMTNMTTSVIKELFDKIVKMIQTFFKMILEIVMKFLTKAAAIVGKIIMELIKLALEALKEIVTTALDALKSLLMKILNIAIKALDSLLEMLVDMFSQLLEKLIGIVIDFISQIINSVLSLIKWMIDMVRQITELILSFFKNNLVKLVQISSTAQLAAFKMTQARLAESIGLLEAQISALDGVIHQIDQDIQKAMGRVDSDGVGEFMEIANDITKFIEKMLSSRAGIISDLVASAVA